MPEACVALPTATGPTQIVTSDCGRGAAAAWTKSNHAGKSIGGRVGDYLLGRSTLIGIASLMLLLISGYATWHGMRDFIIGVSGGGGHDSGDGLSIPNDLLVVIVVAALTFLMWLALRETFGSHRRLTERLITIPLYLFLALWSIGFGYGFWWSLIAGEEATRSGLAGLQEDARDASSAIAARLDAVRGQLDSVVSWSDTQMAREENSGGSWGQPRWGSGATLQRAAGGAGFGDDAERRHGPELVEPGASRDRPPQANRWRR